MLIERFIPNDKIVAIIPYGSHVYGTNNYQSDIDYVVIVTDDVICDEQYRLTDADYSIFKQTHFQTLLNKQCIAAIEPYFTKPIFGSLECFTYKVNLSKLREEISKRASNSFVKCKKKLTVETNEERIGLKSLFHSLRMIDFGIQIAETGCIYDFTASNHYLYDIFEIGPNWDKLKEKYQPIYNQLSSKFREVAPK